MSFLFIKRLVGSASIWASIVLFSILPVHAHATVYPLTIENCGNTLTFDAAPERVLATYFHTAEILFALGLGDRVVGLEFMADTVPPTEELATQFAQIPVTSDHWMSREVSINLQPDFVFSAYPTIDFDPSNGSATQEDFQSIGANIYGMTAECFADATQVTLESIFTDIHNIGLIFDVQHDAEHLIETLQEQLTEIATATEGLTPVRAMIYTSGESPVGVFANGVYGDMLRLAGAESIFIDSETTYLEASLEEVITRDPEWFVALDWRPDVPYETVTDFLLTTFPTTTASINNQIVRLTGWQITPGISTFEGIVNMARAFHPEAFADEGTISLSVLENLPDIEVDLDSYPVTVENCGRELTFDAPPSRVVSLWQPPTEILLALGASDRFVALAGSYAAYPDLFNDAVNGIPSIGSGMMWPSREVLLSQTPDFVISEGLDSFGYDPAQGYATVADIEQSGAQVFSTGKCYFSDPNEPNRTIDDVLNDIRVLGQVFGVSDRAEALIANMEAQRSDVLTRLEGLEPVRVAFYNGGEGPLIVLNSGIWAHLIEVSGGEDVFATVASYSVSVEEFAAADPDVILVGYYPGQEPDDQLAYLKATFPTLQAIQNNRLYPIATIDTENSIRITQGLEHIAQALHPEAFE